MKRSMTLCECLKYHTTSEETPETSEKSVRIHEASDMTYRVIMITALCTSFYISLSLTFSVEDIC